MPSHWADMPRDTPVMYKELPLPPGCSLPHDANSGQSALPPADPAVVQAMVWHVSGRGCVFADLLCSMIKQTVLAPQVYKHPGLQEEAASYCDLLLDQVEMLHAST